MQLRQALVPLGILAVTAAAILLFAPRSGQAGTTLYGDADCSGAVSSIDAALVLQQSAGLVSSLPCDENADVNDDGRVTSVDAALVLQYTAGLIDSIGPQATPTPPPPPAGSPILALDKFGGGTVTSSPGGISCSGSCTSDDAAFQQGSLVTLSATAAAGYVLSGWTGCDSTTGGTCRVTLDGNRTVLVTFALSNVEIPETTKVLDDATMAQLVRQEGSTYIFDTSPQGIIAGLAPGDVIVSAAGDGLLRKVTGLVAGQPAGGNLNISVLTEDATLEDAIERGTLAFSEEDDLASGQLAGFETAGGVTCVISELRCSVPLDFDFGDYGISGNAAIDIDPDIAVSFDGFELGCLCFPVREVRSIAKFKSEGDVRMYIEREFSVGADHTFPVATGTWVVFVGVVPVVLQLEIGVNVGVSGSAQAGMESEMSLDHTLTLGGHYRRGSGWRNLTSFEEEFTSTDPHVTASADARVWVKPVVTGKVYAVPGPYFNAEAYGRLHVDPLNDPLWSLYAGMKASAGVETEVFGLTVVDFTLPLWEREWLLADKEGGPSTSPSNGRVAFDRSVNGNVDIYLANSDGSTPRRLTNDPGFDTEPAWSPDGTRIAFSRLSGGPRDVFGDIYVMDADGSNQRRLTTGANDRSPSWAPDGRRIAFARCEVSIGGGDCQIYVMNADGSGQENLTNDEAQSEFDPAWAPDGSRIAVAQARSLGGSYIVTIDLDGTQRVDLATGFEPAWSPSGTRLAFIRVVAQKQIGLFTIAPDGTHEQLIKTGVCCMDWAPDGSKMIVETADFAAPRIVVMNPDGTEQVTLIDNAGSPDWQPVFGSP